MSAFASLGVMVAAGASLALAVALGLTTFAISRARARPNGQLAALRWATCRRRLMVHGGLFVLAALAAGFLPLP